MVFFFFIEYAFFKYFLAWKINQLRNRYPTQGALRMLCQLLSLLLPLGRTKGTVRVKKIKIKIKFIYYV